MSTEETVTIHILCQCGAHRIPVAVPTSQLPISTWTCSCASCRHMSGAPFITHGALPGLDKLFPGLSPPEFEGLPAGLSLYASNPRGARIFCTTCGTKFPLLYQDQADNIHWSVPLGSLDLGSLAPEKVYKPAALHFHVGAVGDGGFVRWLPEGGIYANTWPGMGDFTIPKEVGQPHTHTNAQGQDVLKGSCKCKGVQYEVLRPEAKPNAQGVKEMSASPCKWTANHCFCESCRLSLGHLLPTFVSVGKDHINWLSKDTLKVYNSSPDKGMKRSFCGKCGASVGTAIDKNGWMDLNVGLIDLDGDYEDGKEKESLAGLLKDWVEWKEEFSFGEEAKDPQLRDEIRQRMVRDGVLVH